MSKHSPEPWLLHRISNSLICIYERMEKNEADAIAQIVQPDSRKLQDANAARIVACVNACAGIDDPAAYLAACAELIDHIPGIDLASDDLEGERILVKIAAAKGKP